MRSTADPFNNQLALLLLLSVVKHSYLLVLQGGMNMLNALSLYLSASHSIELLSLGSARAQKIKYSQLEQALVRHLAVFMNGKSALFQG